MKELFLRIKESIFNRGTAGGVFEETTKKLTSIKVREARRASASKAAAEKARKREEAHLVELEKVNKGIEGYKKIFGLEE